MCKPDHKACSQGVTTKALDLLGITITIAGIAWAVSERTYSQNGLDEDHPDSGTLTRGVMLALVASVGQAVGLVRQSDSSRW